MLLLNAYPRATLLKYNFPVDLAFSFYKTELENIVKKRVQFPNSLLVSTLMLKYVNAHYRDEAGNIHWRANTETTQLRCSMMLDNALRAHTHTREHEAALALLYEIEQHECATDMGGPNIDGYELLRKFCDFKDALAAPEA